MELPDALPDARVPAARRSPLLDPPPADAIQQAQPAWDASAAAHPDAAADAPIPALADAPCVEKLVVPVQGVLAPSAEALPPMLQSVEAKALYIPAAGRSAA